MPDDFVNPQGENPLRTEAEAYQAIEEPFRVIQDNEASAYAAIAAPNETAKGKGHVTYRLRVPATGDYRLYARVFWEDGCSNSLAMESEAGMVVLSSDIFSRWHTLRAARALSLEEGEQTIIIRNLEDGVRIDYWGLQPE